jgi:hypothetical protein
MTTEPDGAGSNVGTISWSTDGGYAVMSLQAASGAEVVVWMPLTSDWSTVDLTDHVADGAVLEFWVKSDNVSVSNTFHVGLGDASTPEVSGTVSIGSYVTLDDTWQLVQIPLADIEAAAGTLDETRMKIFKLVEWPTDGIDASFKKIRITGGGAGPGEVATVSLSPATATIQANGSQVFTAQTLAQAGSPV